MKLRNKFGVKLKMWEYFCVFAVYLLLLIWLLQVVFLQYYYTGAMARQTLNGAKQLVKMYNNGLLTNNVIREKAYQNNVFIIITDKNGEIKTANDIMGEIGDKRIDKLNRYVNMMCDIRNAVDKSPNHEYYHRFESDGQDKSIFLYAAYTPEGTIEGGAYIYVISQLEPIDSVIIVLQRQFIIISVISLVFAILFSYLIARKFSRPVEKLTAGARELALGNTDVKFEVEGAFGEIDELSKALDYASKELTKASSLRRELMANVSHDLRTPLTMIKMYAEMILDIAGDNKEKREKALKIIIDETDRLSKLVNDILELSKIEGGNKKFEMRAFNISETVTKILERFSVMREQGYSFNLETPGDVYVLGDEERIEQVIYNLLSNAVNYTGEDKKVKVLITKKFECARIEVIDTGKGIPQDELANIWDRYYRAKTHIRSTVGTGLGLSIVKSILIAHNADFGIESTIGKGSDFWFELKLPETSANKMLRLTDNNSVSDENHL